MEIRFNVFYLPTLTVRNLISLTPALTATPDLVVVAIAPAVAMMMVLAAVTTAICTAGIIAVKRSKGVSHNCSFVLYNGSFAGLGAKNQPPEPVYESIPADLRTRDGSTSPEADYASISDSYSISTNSNSAYLVLKQPTINHNPAYCTHSEITQH